MLPTIHHGAAVTMSSREIADLTGKRHDHVLRDMRAMLVGLYGDESVKSGMPDKDLFEVFCDRMGWGIASPKLGNERIQGVAVSRDSRGFIAEISLDYNHSMTLVAGYEVKLRKTIIDRWQHLESLAAPPVPQTFAQALRLAADQAEQIEAQQAQIEAQRPAVEFVDRFVEAKSAKGFREVAKILGVREREFIADLADRKIIFKQGSNWLPMAEHQHAGYFEVKAGEANGHAFHQTRFTPEGIAWIAKRYSDKQKAA